MNFRGSLIKLTGCINDIHSLHHSNKIANLPYILYHRNYSMTTTLYLSTFKKPCVFLPKNKPSVIKTPYNVIWERGYKNNFTKDGDDIKIKKPYEAVYDEWKEAHESKKGRFREIWDAMFKTKFSKKLTLMEKGMWFFGAGGCLLVLFMIWDAPGKDNDKNTLSRKPIEEDNNKDNSIRGKLAAAHEKWMKS